MAKLIVDRYALSLFEVALELDKIQTFEDDLKSIEKVFTSEDKLFKILKHPRISKIEKKDLMKEIFEDKISEEVLNFLFITIDKGREAYLLEVIKAFYIKCNEYRNIVDIKAVTAVPMNAKAQEKLIGVMEDKLKKTVRLSNEVDKSIMGGVLLKMDNKFIDNTLVSQLKAMETAIRGASL